MKKDNLNKGVTLIALIITIIVLLILAGITLALVMGDNGILGKANRSKEESNKAQAIEDVRLKVLEVQSEKEGKATLKDVVQKLKDADDTYKITVTSQQAVLANGSIAVENVTEDIDKLYVTNTKYGYEVEIGKNLVIAKDGKEDPNGTYGGNLGGAESQLINSIDFEVAEVKGTSVTLRVIVDEESRNNVVGYFAFCDGNVVQLNKNNELKIENLTNGIRYRFRCVAIDNKGNLKTTRERAFSTDSSKVRDYPLITLSGVKNMEKAEDDGSVSYYRDISQGACTAEDALPIAAWDGDTNSCVRSGTYFVELASEMIGKTFVWTQYWQSYCTSNFVFCDANKDPIGSSIPSDVSGSATVPQGAKYVRYYSNGHYLYEVGGQE